VNIPAGDVTGKGYLEEGMTVITQVERMLAGSSTISDPSEAEYHDWGHEVDDDTPRAPRLPATQYLPRAMPPYWYRIQVRGDLTTTTVEDATGQRYGSTMEETLGELLHRVEYEHDLIGEHDVMAEPGEGA